MSDFKDRLKIEFDELYIKVKALKSFTESAGMKDVKKSTTSFVYTIKIDGNIFTMP